jgi:hypothetical protein
VRLQAEKVDVAVHAGARVSGLGGQRANAPMRRSVCGLARKVVWINSVTRASSFDCGLLGRAARDEQARPEGCPLARHWRWE